MIIYLIRQNEIVSIKVASEYKGNYWIKCKNDSAKSVNLINIEVTEGSYVAKSNEDASIEINGAHVESANLNMHNFYTIKTKKEKMLLYTMPLYDNSFRKYYIKSDNITIGKTDSNIIVYGLELISDNHATIIKTEEGLEIVSNESAFGVYVNKEKVERKKLEVGDSIFIAGLRIIYMGEFWLINNPNNMLKLNYQVIEEKQDVFEETTNEIKSDPYMQLYSESDYFEKAPRFITEFEPQKVVIDPPPNKQNTEEMPLLLTIGPMMTMAITSMVTAWQVISNMANGADIKTVLPSLITVIAMMMTMLLWPILSSKYQKKRSKQKEAERQEKYQKYLLKKKIEIQNLMKREKQIVIDNNVPLEECQNIIINKKINLWEKEIYQKDFLTVRLGIGSVKPSIDISYPEEHFTMEEDNLKDLLSRTVKYDEYIKEVPISISLIEKKISEIRGEEKLVGHFLDSILLQLMTFHSYRDLKIIILKSEEDERLSYMKMSQYLFSDDMLIRFYGDNIDDIEQISNYLTRIFDSRLTNENVKAENFKNYNTYYLILADNDIKIKHTGIVKKILETELNFGFSVIFLSNNLSSLPKECTTFITISGENGKTSGYFENELIAGKQKQFIADLNYSNRVNLPKCVEALNKIPLRKKDNLEKMPKTISFLELYNAGKVEQLNVEYRWKKNDPTLTLNAPIGIDENGSIFKLDLHEKRHGPHGLIAGMTGSGKSEFIITYILSMAINYHPYEVSFVLIDYKGGGLAGAFENRKTGLVLPHLAGTITNLDISTMNRALASIHSELQRRQILFNEAREQLGESTIDIYKYQRFYREGKVDKPISHLVIISDEFAELKQQRPEFMTELISAARIGRSLGVHLILATQKPSGIVDDQIWSNSKFRVCLKVQDRSDSNDVIGRPDAAALIDVGRFYLQVGYNELFALGQSAYSGASYYPQDKMQKRTDTSINFIDNIGNTIKTSDDNIITVKPSGEELTNIVKYLISISAENNIKVDKLWLDQLRNIIYVDELKRKYGYTPTKNIINPIIGEFDDPGRQRQGLLTLPLSEDGNTIIYGVAGSGKQDLLSTMIYSIITEHDASEASLYILDFGSEILKMFSQAPQVGEVVSIDEEEKVQNLFKMLNTAIEYRKTSLEKYNGDFKLYNQKEEKKLATYIVIINNYEAFSESYEECNNMLAVLSREGLKYGIIFVLACSASNAVRYRISQNFKQLIPLQLNDPLDYRTILGKTGGIIPSDNVGRGLIKMDGVYEFQTAIIADRESQFEYVRQVCKELSIKSKYKATSIPVLPERISINLLKQYISPKTNGYFPVGIYKDDLKVAYQNIKNNIGTIVSSIDQDAFANFINPLIREFIITNKVIVIDAMEMVEKDDTFNYHNTKFDETIDELNNYIEKLYNQYSSHNYDASTIEKEENIICVISGVGNLLNRIKSETKEKFENMFTKDAEVKKVWFVIVDTATNLKRVEFDNWYKAAITQNAGIWIGNGINDQSVIKLAKLVPNGNIEIKNNYGYVVNKGNAQFTKLLEGEMDGKQNTN